MQTANTNTERKQLIAKKIKEKNVPLYLKGYMPLVELVNLRYEDPYAKLLDDLCVRVGKMYGKTYNNIERVARAAIKSSDWKDKTLNDFISSIAWEVRSELNDF